MDQAPVIAVRWNQARAVVNVSGGVGSFEDLNLTPGLDYPALIHPDDRAAVLEQNEQAELDCCYRLLDEKGHVYPVREWSRKCRDNAREREGLIIIQNDDETRVRERMLRCEKELQDFAYIASHDLMEPLRKIQAFGDRLNQKYASELGESGQDYLVRMLNATGRLHEFLDGLLEYSRVFTRGKPFSKCDLHLMCEEQAARLSKKSDVLDARIAIGSMPAIDADCDQIRQLIHHLLDNALKFHIEGVRPVIAISSEVKGGKVEIRVKDNGTGFAQSDAEKVFQIFQRLHGRSKYQGSGIGLSVCRRIVERHSGEIHAVSEPGRGATMIILLPVTQKVKEETNDEV